MVRRIVAGLFLIVGVLAGSLAARAGADTPADPFAEKLLARINAERKKAGAAPLVDNEELHKTAAAQAKACAEADTWKGDGKNALERVADKRFVAVTYWAGWGSTALEMWVKERLEKPGIRERFLDPRNTQYGVGVSKAKSGNVYAVVMLGMARSRVDTPKERAKVVEEMVKLVNAERAKEGLKPVKLNAELSAAAQGHAENMAKQQRMDHVLDGKTPQDRIRVAGYKGTRGTENVASAQQDPEEVMKMWMNSPPHRKNILNPALQEIGVGIGQDAKTGDLYWCQCFGVRE
jgi:uncharacterized protein YkwD